MLEKFNDLYSDDLKMQTRQAIGGKRDQIISQISKCEYCGKKAPSHHLHLHHLDGVTNATESRELNTQDNLMVLCLFCHADAHVTKDNQKYKSKKNLKEARNRSSEDIKEIRRILQGKNKSPRIGLNPLPPGYGSEKPPGW